MKVRPSEPDKSKDLQELGVESLAFDVAPIPLLIVDDANTVAAANSTARKLFAPSSASLVGQQFKELPLELRNVDARRWINIDQVLDNLKEAVKGKDNPSSSFEAISRQSDQKPLELRIDLSTCHTSSGERYTSLSLIKEDRSSRESKPRDVVDEIVNMKDMVLDHMHELAVFCISTDGNLLVTNKAAHALLGDVTPVVGQGIRWLYDRWTVYTPDFSETLPFEKWCIYDLLTKGQVVRQTIGYYDPEGKPRVIEIGGEPIKGENGTQKAGIVWLKDETEWNSRGDIRFQQICNTMPQIIFALNADTQPEYFNEQWYKFTGLSPDELVKKGQNPMMQICHEDDILVLEEAWRQAQATGEILDAQFRCRRRDGAFLWMLCRASCLRDDKGNIKNWYGTLTDVDEKTNAVENALKVKRQLHETILHSHLCVMHVDNLPNRNISFIAGSAIFPGLETLSIGENFLEVFRNADQFTGPLERFMMQADDVASLEELTQEIDFRGRWYRCRFTPVKSKRKSSLGGKDAMSIIMDDTLQVDGVVLVIADITARYLSDQALKKSSEEQYALAERESAALKATQLKSTFLANASHEIRTPISQIIGMAEVLIDTDLLPEQQRFAHNIYNSAFNLKAVISDILDLSKIEAGKMTISKAAFDLSLLLQEIVDMFTLTTSKKGLEFEHLSTLSDSDCLVVGDQGRVRQILTNLLGNAFKFTSEGYIRMTTIRAKDQPSPDLVKVKFMVEDSGVGISEDSLSNVFLPFSQADSKTGIKFGGTGLGLSISKELVELMNGEIALERSKGGSAGCVAWFSIPFERYTGKHEVETISDGEDLLNRFKFDMERSLRQGAVASIHSKGLDQAPPIPRTSSVSVGSPRTMSPRTNASSKMPPPPRPVPLSPGINDFHNRMHAFDYGVKVLVVEDDETIRKVVLKHLERFGCKVTTGTNGVEGLEILEKNRKTGSLPDVVFTDCRMPHMDGYTFTRRIRSHPDPAVRSLIVIAMSAATLIAEQEMCQAAGVTGFLSKPAKREELYEILVQHLGRRESASSED